MSSALTAKDVFYELPDGRPLFGPLNFSLGLGRTALVGPNGVGKTCLARLLAGELEPTQGKILNSQPVRYFPQHQTAPSCSVNKFLSGVSSGSFAGELFLGDIDREISCSQLSGGEWMRVRLSAVLDDAFLILDEPTNNLDQAGRNAVLQFLREASVGILLISHDRECLNLCEEILELSPQGLRLFGGGWESYQEQSQNERAHLEQALDQAKKSKAKARSQRQETRERQEKRNKQGRAAAAKGGIPKILLGGRKSRAQGTTGKLDRATQTQVEASVTSLQSALEALKIDPVMYAEFEGHALPAQKLVARGSGFNLFRGRRLYTQDLNFHWKGNARVHLKGANGSGKSSFLHVLAGVNGASMEVRGEFQRGDFSALLLDQSHSSLEKEKSIFENVRQFSTLSESEIRGGLAKFLFFKDKVFQKAGDLSGGERLRAALAQAFLSSTRPEVLLLDEPTNDLDLANVEFLEKLVAGFKGAVFLISHDPVFVKNCGVNEELFLS